MRLLDYEIIIESGSFKRLAELIRIHLSPKPSVRLVVITDENVFGIYGKALSSALDGFEHSVLTLPAGEGSKSIQTLEQVYGFCADMKLTRSDMLVAFGGGVIGDLVGFAAATYMRGLPFVQVPTTLLSQVDSSIGGKTAVNIPQGKNLVGAFNQPALVVIDPTLTDTLTEREFACGMAEVIKYAAINSKKLYDLLSENNSKEKILPKLAQVVQLCCEIKAEYVREDPFDKGVRRLLNFGHTFGHAIEKHFDFSRYNHGEAVAMGMCLAFELGEKLGICKTELGQTFCTLIKNFDLPVYNEVDIRLLLPTIALDKKAEGKEINFVFVKDIGDSFVRAMSLDEMEDLMC